MKIAITGITGFIGKNLLEKLVADENEYICFVRKSSSISNLLHGENIRFKVINFSQSDFVKEFQTIDVVIHMIGQMGGYGITTESFENINCKMTRFIVEACISANVRQLIYLSTPGVQGFGKRLCLESEPYAPRNIYEQTKAEAEKIIIRGLSKSSTKYTIIRPDFVYGPGDTRRIKMYKNIRDKKFVLTTSGKCFLHPTYVMDVVQGIMRSIGNPYAYNEIFNISAESDISVKEYLMTIADYFSVPLIHINIGYKTSIFLAALIEKICNNIFKREGIVSKNKIDFLALDHSTSHEKATRLLGYCAEYTFEKGFVNTMKWYEKEGLI